MKIILDLIHNLPLIKLTSKPRLIRSSALTSTSIPNKIKRKVKVLVQERRKKEFLLKNKVMMNNHKKQKNRKINSH